MYILFFYLSVSLAFILRLVVLSVVLFGLPYGSDQSCSVTLVDHGRGYLGILVSCLICESAIMWLSMRGSILYTQPREAVQYVIYIRLGKTRRHTHFYFWGSLLHRITSWCLWELEEVVGRITCGSKLRFEQCLYWLGRYWSFSSLPLSLYISSNPVGRASVCCGGNCLACPVLPAMLWCHCQKPGFGWVKEYLKERIGMDILG